MAIITASEFAKDPGPSIKLAEETGEPTIIVRGGKPFAAVLHPDHLRGEELAKLSDEERALLDSSGSTNRPSLMDEIAAQAEALDPDPTDDPTDHPKP